MPYLKYLFVFLTCCSLLVSVPAKADPKESAFERIMRTETIRCGYFTREPMSYKSLQSGEMEGIFVEYTEALAKSLGLKVEWTEELGAADAIEAVKTGRVDAVCSAMWPNAPRMRYVDFVKPIFYEPLILYTRASDTRFDNNASLINSPDVSIITIEGITPSKVAEVDFPKAKKIELPQLTPLSDMWLSLATGKGDVVIGETAIGKDFMKHNPDKVRIVPLDRPVRFSGPGIMVSMDDPRLTKMLDLATDDLLYTGRIEPILKKYEKYQGSFYRVSLPYTPPAK